MILVPNTPPDDIFSIDLSALKPFLVDLPAGATKGMRHQQDGFDEAVHEIVVNQPTFGDRAGITATDFAKFQALNSQYSLIAADLPTVSKAHDVLVESLAYVDNLRNRLASTFATSAEAHAAAEGGIPRFSRRTERPSPTDSASADKAVKTREKNEEAKALKGSKSTTTTKAEEPTAGATGGTVKAEAATGRTVRSLPRERRGPRGFWRSRCIM